MALWLGTPMTAAAGCGHCACPCSEAPSGLGVAVKALKDVCAASELPSQGARDVWGVAQPGPQEELDTGCVLAGAGQMQG